MCPIASCLSSRTDARVERLSRRAVASSRWLQASRSRTARCSAVRAATAAVVSATCRRVLRVEFRVSCICSLAFSTSPAILWSCRPIVFRNSSWSSMSEKFPESSTTEIDDVRSEV